MRSADYLVDIGPMAGKHGGLIVSQGTPEEVTQDKTSPTGRFLKGEETIETPKDRRKVELPFNENNNIQIIGAQENNLKDVTANIPLRKFVCITGVSGSGKSTLINSIFANHLMNYFMIADYPQENLKILKVSIILTNQLSLIKAQLAEHLALIQQLILVYSLQFVSSSLLCQSPKLVVINKVGLASMYQEEDVKPAKEMVLSKWK